MLRTLLAVWLMFSCVQLAHAASYPAPVEGDYVVRDFAFASGEVLPELKLHYTTIGSPVLDETGLVTNAVLILHGTGGRGGVFLTEQFAGSLFGPGQPLDAQRYYLILPDSIGAGKSSKPSDGLRCAFLTTPTTTWSVLSTSWWSIDFDVNHLRLILGTSMGCMHAWMWAENYPRFMDALLPMACQPAPICGAQPHAAPDDHGRHSQRSRVAQRRLRKAASRVGHWRCRSTSSAPRTPRSCSARRPPPPPPTS